MDEFSGGEINDSKHSGDKKADMDCLDVESEKFNKSSLEVAAESDGEPAAKMYKDDKPGSDPTPAKKELSEARETIIIKPKTKKKKKHGLHGSHHHHKGFKNSKGHRVFDNASPVPEDMMEEEVVTHVVGKKPLLGKVWRRESDGVCARYRCYNYGIEYKPGDAVYIESQQQDQPYHICAIQVPL